MENMTKLILIIEGGAYIQMWNPVIEIYATFGIGGAIESIDPLIHSKLPGDFLFLRF